MCGGDLPAARSNERRSVLPSTATTPRRVSAKRRRKRVKQVSNAFGSSRRDTRLKVSWREYHDAGAEIGAGPALLSPRTAPCPSSPRRQIAWCRARSSTVHAGCGGHCPAVGPQLRQSKRRTLPQGGPGAGLHTEIPAMPPTPQCLRSSASAICDSPEEQHEDDPAEHQLVQTAVERPAEERARG